MSDKLRDAIRAREDAKRPIPEPEPKPRARKQPEPVVEPLVEEMDDTETDA